MALTQSPQQNKYLVKEPKFESMRRNGNFIHLNEWNVPKIQYENQELVRIFQYLINIY